MERISAGRPRRQGAAKASPAPEIAPAPEPLIEEPAAEQEPTLEHEPVVPLATPEPVFAARVRPPAPGPPLPTSRRAIFYDVENASHPAHIARVIEHLTPPHRHSPTTNYEPSSTAGSDRPCADNR